MICKILVAIALLFGINAMAYAQNDTASSRNYEESVVRLKSACELAAKSGVDTSEYLQRIKTYDGLRLGETHNADGFMIMQLDSLRTGLARQVSAAKTALPDLRSVNQIEIVQTGSTNSIGYEITILRSGQATLVVDSNPAQPRGDLRPNPGGQVLTASLPELSSQLFSLAASQPLETLRYEGIVHSASFGTSTYLKLGDHQSQDLAGAARTNGAALWTCVSAIKASFKPDLWRYQGKTL